VRRKSNLSPSRTELHNNYSNRANLNAFLMQLGQPSAPEQQPMNIPSMDKFVFLTRQGCVNTVTMRESFDDALKAVGLPLQYQFIDADTLAPSDPRAGYGTPTVLYDGRDLFDMPEPPVPHPPPT